MIIDSINFFYKTYLNHITETSSFGYNLRVKLVTLGGKCGSNDKTQIAHTICSGISTTKSLLFKNICTNSHTHTQRMVTAALYIVGENANNFLKVIQ